MSILAIVLIVTGVVGAVILLYNLAEVLDEDDYKD